MSFVFNVCIFSYPYFFQAARGDVLNTGARLVPVVHTKPSALKHSSPRSEAASVLPPQPHPAEHVQGGSGSWTLAGKQLQGIGYPNGYVPDIRLVPKLFFSSRGVS